MKKNICKCKKLLSVFLVLTMIFTSQAFITLANNPNEETQVGTQDETLNETESEEISEEETAEETEEENLAEEDLAEEEPASSVDEVEDEEELNDEFNEQDIKLNDEIFGNINSTPQLYWFFGSGTSVQCISMSKEFADQFEESNPVASIIEEKYLEDEVEYECIGFQLIEKIFTSINEGKEEYKNSILANGASGNNITTNSISYLTDYFKGILQNLSSDDVYYGAVYKINTTSNYTLKYDKNKINDEAGFTFTPEDGSPVSGDDVWTTYFPDDGFDTLDLDDSTHMLNEHYTGGTITQNVQGQTYNLIGWSTEPNGDKDYEVGEGLFSSALQELFGDNDTVTLYALWQVDFYTEYKIEFDKNLPTNYTLLNGTNWYESFTAIYDENFDQDKYSLGNESDVIKCKNGNTTRQLIGWSQKADWDGDNAEYALGREVMADDFDDGLFVVDGTLLNNGDTLTLYAVWGPEVTEDVDPDPNPDPNPDPTPNNNNNNNSPNRNTSGGSTDGGGGNSSPSVGPMGDLTKNNPAYNPQNQQVNSVNNIPQNKLINDANTIAMLKSMPKNQTATYINAKDISGNTGFGQWQQVAGTQTWYFLSGDFNANGTRGTVGLLSDGWYNLGWAGRDEWYHFNADGTMGLGWYQEGGKTYYLEIDINDYWYGKTVTGVHNIGGQIYNFDSTGALIQ